MSIFQTKLHLVKLNAVSHRKRDHFYPVMRPVTTRVTFNLGKDVKDDEKAKKNVNAD